MSRTDDELRESARLRHWLREADAIQTGGGVEYALDGVASEQSDTIAQQRHLGLLPRVPLRRPGVDG